MVSEPGTIGERLDALERLRDPSHATSPRQAALHAEAAGGTPTGLHAAIVDGALTITHRYLLVHATRA